VFPGSIATKVTKKQIEGFNVAAKWKKFKGCAPNEAGLFLQILVTFPAIKAYRKL